MPLIGVRPLDVLQRLEHLALRWARRRSRLGLCVTD